jgi:hypothetical protein
MFMRDTSAGSAINPSRDYSQKWLGIPYDTGVILRAYGQKVKREYPFVQKAFTFTQCTWDVGLHGKAQGFPLRGT